MTAYFDIDHTHDPARKSWVASANKPQTDFPLQNLPLGIFSCDQVAPRVGIAIGDQILDLTAAFDAGLLGDSINRDLLTQSSLNSLFAAGHQVGMALREMAFAILSAEDPLDARRFASSILVDMDAAQLHLPAQIGNYTDFYAGIHHAIRAGTLLQPENPLPDNYKWMPIGYHGRASTVKASGGNIRRPKGQLMTAQSKGTPTFGPCNELDLELEMAVWLGQPNQHGEPIDIARAREHIAGFGLLNDWSARDIQRWEMKPLGPFLAKNFGTTVSTWVLTPYALAPFRVAMAPRPQGDPAPLPHLFSAQDQAEGTFEVALEVHLRTPQMKVRGEPSCAIIHSNMRDLYWTPAQMLAHHSAGGCEMLSGDLLGTGTISGPVDDELGSLLELTENGSRPVTLPNGEIRTYLQDGDEVTLKGRCHRDGFVSIGFGDCRGTITPAI